MVETLEGIHKDGVEILLKIIGIVAVGTFMKPHKVLQRLRTIISMLFITEEKCQFFQEQRGRHIKAVYFLLMNATLNRELEPHLSRLKRY